MDHTQQPYKKLSKAQWDVPSNTPKDYSYLNKQSRTWNESAGYKPGNREHELRESLAKELLEACQNYKSDLGCFPNLAGCTHKEDAALILGITLDQLIEQLGKKGLHGIRCRWNVDTPVDKHSPENIKRLQHSLEQIKERNEEEMRNLKSALRKKYPSVPTPKA